MNPLLMGLPEEFARPEEVKQVKKRLKKTLTTEVEQLGSPSAANREHMKRKDKVFIANFTSEYVLESHFD